MKLALALAALVALVLPCSALAARETTPAPDNVTAFASLLASRPVEIACYTRGEPGDPYDVFGAWGFVWVTEEQPNPIEHMAAEVCEGAAALATDDPLVDDWKKALGALVITHESYHLAKRYRDRHSEAQTECRAVRHVRYAMQALGASPETASRLMGWALAIHWRIASLAPQYNLEGCAVPNPW